MTKNLDSKAKPDLHQLLRPSPLNQLNKYQSTLNTIFEKWYLARPCIVCIDGPSASGKGTLAKKLAQSLGFEYLDSGLLYRAIAYAAVLYFKSITEINKIKSQVESPNPHLLNQALDFERLQQSAPQFLEQILEYFNRENIFLKAGHIYHQDLDVTAQLRNEKIGLFASTLAKYPVVRQALLDRQREMATQCSLVADGRDMGTVVFPKADFKFFLTASIEERAWRRFCELHPDMNLNEVAIKSPEYQKVFNSIQVRDFQDTNRDSAPLMAASDAVLIDSEDLNSEEVFDKVMQVIQANIMNATSINT